MAVFTISVMELREDDWDFGLDVYPIFDPNYRAPLNTKILDHYMNYEIGYESEEMFKFALRRRMNEIMPYYNQLYKSEQIEFDPLQTVNLNDMSESVNTSTASNDNESKARGRVVNSELPQVHLSPNEDYASAATDSVSDSTATGTGTSEANGTVNHQMTGSQGHAPQLLMAYRASLLNIDLMVIRDLANLFMGVWNTNDTHTDQGRLYGYGFGYPSI